MPKLKGGFYYEKEEVLNFDIIFQSWKGEITSNSENYLVREKKIRTLLKKKIPKISFKSYFSQFKGFEERVHKNR